MMAEVIEKVTIGCEFAEAIITQGKVHSWNFKKPCPFKKEKVDAQCIHCVHCTQTVVDYE
jgi:hypothetical protein